MTETDSFMKSRNLAVFVVVCLVVGSLLALLAYESPRPNTQTYAFTLVTNETYRLDVSVGPAGYPAAVHVSANEIVGVTFYEEVCTTGFTNGCSTIPFESTMIGTTFDLTVTAANIGTTNDLFIDAISAFSATVYVSVTWTG